jgi:type VI secretion system protein ImpJ
MKAHDIPDAIQWHEGLLLTPQHFQQLTSRQEALVQYSTSVIAPFCWGIRRFKHDPITLPTGTLGVAELEAVMPDGLVVSHGPDSANPLQLDLTKLKEQMSDKPLTVYLAVGAGQGSNTNGDAKRYVSFNGPLVLDEVTGGKPCEISRLRPRLALVTDWPQTKYIGFPLASVIYKDSTYQFDDKFIPPLLNIPFHATAGEAPAAAAQRLAALCEETAVLVRNRARYLAAEDRSDARQGEVRSEVETRSLMLSLVGCLPQLEAILKIGGAHPLTVYLALCAMAGQLAVIGKEMVPPNFKRYKHDDLYASFKEVIDFIELTLNQGVPSSYKSYPFQYYQGAFELRFDRSWLSRPMAIALKVPRGMSEADVIKWGKTCLIGSQSKIGSIRDKRTLGVGREHAARVGDIVVGNRFVLFSLTTHREFIESDKFLQIVNYESARPSEIVLHVMEPNTDSAVAHKVSVKP